MKQTEHNWTPKDKKHEICLNCGLLKQFYKNNVQFVKNELIYYIEPNCNNNDKK